MNHMRLPIKNMVLLILVIFCFSSGENISLIYLGIIPGGAPEFEKTLNKHLFGQIQVIAGIEMADNTVVDLIKKRTGFDHDPVVNRSFIEAVKNTSHENTLIVWAYINNYGIKAVQSWYMRRFINANLQLGLTLYSVKFKEYIYVADLESTVRLGKGLQCDYPFKEDCNVTVEERNEACNALQQEIIGKVTVIISGMVRAKLIRLGENPMQNVDSKKVPSVSDLFDIPLVNPENSLPPSEKKKEATIEKK